MSDVIQILSAIVGGDPEAADQLLPLVSDGLRRLAARRLAQEKPGQTLRAIALAHEANVRRARPGERHGSDQGAHFVAVVADAETESHKSLERKILCRHLRRKS
jgi:hypothetical protein